MLATPTASSALCTNCPPTQEFLVKPGAPLSPTAPKACWSLRRFCMSLERPLAVFTLASVHLPKAPAVLGRMPTTPRVLSHRCIANTERLDCLHTAASLLLRKRPCTGSCHFQRHDVGSAVATPPMTLPKEPSSARSSGAQGTPAESSPRSTLATWSTGAHPGRATAVQWHRILPHFQAEGAK